ncbi:MAG: hypothetical protein IRZ13_21370 [Acetobacteraceae bacterium]|nr:hypothetical protein [Acetobacteraceae bacterium]
MRQALRHAGGAGHPAALPRAAPVAAMLAVVLALGGCAELGGNLFGNGAADAASQQAAAEPTDPLAAFAAQARPGAEATVADPATGRAVRVRLVRAYAAASGRECREVALLGTGVSVAGGGGPRRLICRGEGGVWTEARPLLRSGIAAAPGGTAFP